MGIDNCEHFFNSGILKKKTKRKIFQKWEICELILSSLVVLTTRIMLLRHPEIKIARNHA